MKDTETTTIIRRSSMLYVVVFLLSLIVVARLFYLQVIQHDYYAAAAIAEHQAKFSIPANRGQIYARDGQSTVPLVLNEVLPTVFVDPVGINDDDNADIARKLADILGMPYEDVISKLEKDQSRYEIIKHKISYAQAKAIKEAELGGVGLSDQSYRVYPQKKLAAQILGFVNNENQGQYGIEQYLNSQLSGTPGRLSAITDVFGIPLSNNEENVIEAPKNGEDVTLTIDVNAQQFVEEALEKGVKSSGGKSGSAVVVDPNTGAVVAMANYPSYDPAKYGEVEDFERFSNGVVSAPYETGSGVKVFTMATGLQEGVVTPQSTFYDAGYVQVDDRKIENAGLLASGVNRTMQEVIQNSVNTGVVHVLKQLGGGEINPQARQTLYSYFTDKFGLTRQTGIEQANEAGGAISEPGDTDGINVRYANMTFGQGMTVTMMQMVAGVSALVNGGDYYQPYLVHSTTEGDKTTVHDPRLLRPDVISPEVSRDIVEMMRRVVAAGGGVIASRQGYMIGGKTGTAQVLDEKTGEYSDEREVGSFIGFGGSDKPKYVIMTKVEEPQIPGYAGTVAAAPIFAAISNWLIDYYQLPPTAN